MARLMTARLTDDSPFSTVDNAVATLEESVAELLGRNLDEDYVGSIIPPAGATYDFSMITQPAALSNFSSYAPFATTRTLAAGALNAVGKLCRIRAGGVYASPVADNVNVLFRCRVGSSTPVFDSNLVAAHQVQLDSDCKWKLECDLITRTTGATGTVHPFGRLTTAGAAQAGMSLNFWTTQTPITLDLTGTLLLVIAGYFTSADPTRSATMTYFNVEIAQAGATI